MEYESEENLLNKVEKCLKENGFLTWREVVPDACEDWDLPYRVDLVFYRDDIGFIGVEAKNTNSLRSGGKIAKAIKQIDKKYRNQTYFKGNMISRWCILVPLATCDFEMKLKNEVIVFLRGFLQDFNIELLEYEDESKWKKSKISIGKFFKNKIEIGGN